MGTKVEAYSQDLTAGGTTSGVATVADSSGYWPGAYAWLKGPVAANDDARRVVIKAIVSATQVRVAFADRIDNINFSHGQGAGISHPSNNVADISGFASGSTLAQYEQVAAGVRNDIDKP